MKLNSVNTSSIKKYLMIYAIKKRCHVEVLYVTLTVMMVLKESV